MTQTPDFTGPDLPWSAAASDAQPAARRKVAWGTPFDADAPPSPHPRVDGPAPLPAFGTFEPVPDEPGATPTAMLHAGASDEPTWDRLPARMPLPAAPVDRAPVTSAPVNSAPVNSAAADMPSVPELVAPGGFDVDLSDLFDEAPAAPVATPPAPAAEVLPAAVPDAPFQPTPDPAPAPASQQPSGWSEPIAANAAFTTSAPDEPAPPQAPPAAASRGLDLAARRAALAAAKSTVPAIAHTDGDDEFARYGRGDYYYGYVDRILGLGRGGDPELQAMMRSLELTRDPELDREQRDRYQNVLEPRLATAHIQIANAADRDVIFDMAYDEMIGVGPLGPLWRDDNVNEIMVTGHGKVTVERNGKLAITPVRFRDQEHLEQTARTLAGKFDDRALSPTNPLVTCQLPGARVQFVMKPLSVAKLTIAIRKFGKLMALDDLLRLGALSDEMASFLHDACVARSTVLVSGGTSTGKTTFINALSEFIPDTERVVTIEDALELQLRNTHVEALVTKEAASADDSVLFDQAALLKASLRLRPDRIIVGEIRDGAGCAVMLEAANTGHEGTMTTVHANSPELALQRLATLLRRVDSMPDDVAKREVAGAFDLVVQISRKRGRRFISNISQIDTAAYSNGSAGVVTLFTGGFDKDADSPTFRRVGSLRPDTELAIKMTDAGLDSAVWE